MAFAAKNKKWLGYTLYIVLVTLILLYFLFPAQEVEDFIDNSVSSINPELGFEAEKIGPWIPAGLRIEGGRLVLKSTRAAEVFAVDNMHIKPQILKLVRGDYSLDLSGTAYNGDLDGSYHTKDKDGKTFEGELNFKDLDMADYAFLADKLKHTVTGKFSGEVVYVKDSANAEGEGKADLRLNDGRLQFQNPIFGIGSVDLQDIDLVLKLSDKVITVARAELSGQEVKVSVTGSIQLQADIIRSQLNLKGTLEPLAEFYKKYPEIRELLKSMKKRVKRGQYFFAITGTLGEPRFRML